MEWTVFHTEAKTLKEAFEENSPYLEFYLGLSISAPESHKDLLFFIADYRLKGGKLTLLIQNRKYPDHRELACFFIDLDKKNGHFFEKQVGYNEAFAEKFPMMKTWAKQLLAKQGRCNTDNEWVRERSREFSHMLSDAIHENAQIGRYLRWVRVVISAVRITDRRIV
ncbi:hypothetical protein [Neisseria weaveri]|uniref:hypothetical protein n=1 Tax=Neisseria weaveri TaxID=28091 RepID=UPI001F47DBBD|nr:hypothetical protein [Neisseria weaveri]